MENQYNTCNGNVGKIGSEVQKRGEKTGRTPSIPRAKTQCRIKKNNNLTLPTYSSRDYFSRPIFGSISNYNTTNSITYPASPLSPSDFLSSGQFHKAIQHTVEITKSEVGTMTYASPEQKRGKTYTYNTDLYSLGIICIELFCNFSTNSERAHEHTTPFWKKSQ